MRLAFGFVIALGGLCGVSACGGSSDEDLTGGIAFEDAPNAIAEAACAAASDCYAGFISLFLAGEDCVERTRDALTDSLSAFETAKKAGTARYDEHKASLCVDKIKAAGCDLDAAFESDDCRAALDGTVEVGGDCTSDVECKGEAHCLGSTCPGRCTEPGAVGASCEYDDQCQTGLRCDEDEQRCFQPGAEGAACGGTAAPECENGLFCLGADADSGKAGSCKSIKQTFVAAEGAACNPLLGPLCAAELACVIEAFGASGITAKCLAPVAAGAACKLALPDQCPIGQYCKVAADMIDGTCTPLPSAGSACAKVFDEEACAPYTRCDAGTCKAVQSLGGSCSEDATCYSESCSGGKCVPAGSCS